MGLKDFFLKKVLQSKLKHLPKEQQEMILALVSENPEFFQKLQKQVEAKKAQGKDEYLAMMQVMRENQAEIQKLVMQWQAKQKK